MTAEDGAYEADPRPPLNVQCPACESPRGARCRTTSGTNRTTDTHQARYDRSYGPLPKPETKAAERCAARWHGIRCAEDVADHDEPGMHMTDPNRRAWAKWPDCMSDRPTVNASAKPERSTAGDDA